MKDIADGYIFYYNNGKSYRVNLDGSGRVTLFDGDATMTATLENINVSGDYVYFTVLDDGLYKVKTDGTGLTKVCGDQARNISVIDNTVYYNFYDSDWVLSPTYSVLTDGTDRTELLTQ